MSEDNQVLYNDLVAERTSAYTDLAAATDGVANESVRDEMLKMLEAIRRTIKVSADLKLVPP